MSFLVANVPPHKCYVRKEYLYNLEKGHGEFTEAVWISVKSIARRAIYIEALLPEYGALYDKLPLHAFVSDPETPSPDLPLDVIELWDCFSYDITVVEKFTLSGLRCKFLGKDKQWHHGEYMFTIDACEPDYNRPRLGLSETPDEHKSFNVIALDNGQYAAQPNNRVLWYEASMIPREIKTPDFKVSTHDFAVETDPSWTVGDTREWQYKTKEEREIQQTKENDPLPFIFTVEPGDEGSC